MNRGRFIGGVLPEQTDPAGDTNRTDQAETDKETEEMDLETTNQRDTEDTKTDTGTTQHRTAIDARGDYLKRRNDFQMTKRLPEKNANRNNLLIKKTTTSIYMHIHAMHETQGQGLLVA